MNKVCQLCVALIALLVTFSAFAELYVKYDKDGTAKFSDKPLAGYSIYTASKKSTSFKPPSPANKPSKKIYQPKKAVTKSVTAPIQKIQVMAPSEKETVRSNSGNLLVVSSVTPDNQKNHSVQMYLNGKAYGSSQNSLIFNVEGINRGEHKLKLALLTNTGKIIAMSEPITFYMHRNRVNASN